MEVEKYLILEMKEVIKNTLIDVFKSFTIYDEKLPEIYETPSFVIMVTNQEYSKRMNNRYKNVVSFEITYYSNEDFTNLKADCFEVHRELVRVFDIIRTYRVINKKSSITDNVLHFTFDIETFEKKVEETVKMQDQQLRTNN